ncbi:histidine-containing phosphotransfer protein 2-like [Cucumis melo var. makuwa]|uniref:Histidine-containing phosphotransfer protein n=1 Tax=Cucumis melo var. makuwa TaxID=1194695 RepID=A0A5A7SW52_CUCMM|nr:histidine-containing phosphotransfer protein 2-like [Cucumis melo var. makuwa]
MALSILKGLLQDYVQSLIEERIVSERFSQILTKFEEPDCIQLINIYLKDVESILSELSSTIDSSDLNFSKLSMLADKIDKKSTRYIGAQHMKLASIRLIEACDKEDQKIVSQAVNWMKHEFTITQNKFQPVLQMEQRILRVMSKPKYT